MRKNRQISIKGRTTVAIIGDGGCECWYFQMLKQHETSLSVTLKPEIPQRKKLADIFDSVIKASEIYDKVFWLIDLDVIRKEMREHSSNRNKLKEYCYKIENKYTNVRIIINNPCFEFWILLHYEYTTKAFDNCEKVIHSLKQYLPDYEKSQKYYVKNQNDIYTRLKPYRSKAINNAKKNMTFDFTDFDTSLSQMPLFFDSFQLE